MGDTIPVYKAIKPSSAKTLMGKTKDVIVKNLQAREEMYNSLVLHYNDSVKVGADLAQELESVKKKKVQQSDDTLRVKVIEISDLKAANSKLRDELVETKLQIEFHKNGINQLNSELDALTLENISLQESLKDSNFQRDLLMKSLSDSISGNIFLMLHPEVKEIQEALGWEPSNG